MTTRSKPDLLAAHETKREMHICATKEYVLTQIVLRGARSILKGWAGTDQEAMNAVRTAPGNLIAMEGCDNFDPDHGCRGHAPGTSR